MVTEVISTIAPSGGDYTSMTSWESDRAGDITVVGSDTIEIAEFETFSGGLDNNNPFTGWTTDATHYVVLRNAAGHQHDGTRGTGFFFDRTGAGDTTIRPATGLDDLRLEGLAQDGKVLFSFVNNGAGNTLSIKRLLAYDCANTPIARNATAGVVIENCVVINASGDGFITTGKLYDCEAYGNSNRGFATGSVDGETKGCIAATNTGADYDLQSGSVSSYSISEDGTATGTGSLANRTVKQRSDLPLAAGDYVIFEDTTLGSEDLKIVDDAENDAVNAGNDISGVTKDILGVTRDSPPDIGAWELVAVGGVTIPIFERHYRNMRA